jgi:hypothetical protein
VRDGIKISDAWLEKYRNLGCKLAVFTFEEWATIKIFKHGLIEVLILSQPIGMF